MTISFQQLRSAIPGAQPSQLDVGQLAFNVSDGTMYLGTGGDTRIDFSGEAVLPNPPAGKGWIQFLLERAALEEFFLSNPTSEGGLPPENEQVLTWNSAEGRAEWQDSGTGFAYFTTNAAVAAAPGATTSQKISSAIGNPPHIGANASCVVDGAPGTTYQGLYIYNGTEWKFAAQFSFPLANQVPGTNPMTFGASNVQDILFALKNRDDSLQSQINDNSTDIGTLQGQMAVAQSDIADLNAEKLDKATNIPAAGQILSFDGTGQLWVDDAQGDVTSVTGAAPIVVNNLDPQNPEVSILAASTSSFGAVMLSNSLVSTSQTEAATSLAVKDTYDIAIAAVPNNSYVSGGDILVGTGLGTYGPLGIGSEGQILTVSSGVPAWTTDSPGDVTSVSGTAPIQVNNTNPQTPVVSVDLATTATPGVVQIELTGNLTLVGGVINVPDASTTVKGAVQLNNTLSSNSTTQALTAAQGLALQTQINTLTLANNVVLAGGWDALNGVVDGVTTQGTAAGFVNGDPLPAPGAGNADYYLICVVPGTDPSAMENGDWLLSDGTQWLVLGVGARPGSASYTQQGIVQLADAAAVVDGTSDTLAITPQALQDNVIDAVNVANSSQIASATAVKTAYDAAVAAQTSADNAQTTANAALPKAGGTMTGTLTSTDINVQATHSIQFAGGINGTLDGITDSTSTTDSTVAASATAVKAAADAAAAAQTDADQALIDAGNAQTTADQAILNAAAAQATADAAIPDATFTAAGELLYGTGAGTYNVLPIGTNGQSLIVSGGAIAWGASLQGYTNTATPFNTALGGNAGDSITSGTNNTAVGYNAGTAITTGSSNTLVGYNTGDAMSTGVQNTGVGVNALGSATSVSNTVGVGYNALAALTTGAGNTALGASAGAAVNTGIQNTFVGTSAGAAVTTGSNNTFLGFNTGDAATTASSNVFIGTNAGSIATIGSQNIFIGVNAGDSVTTGFNNTIIGDISGTAALTDTMILATGTTVRFQANSSGAWSPDGTNFGTAGQVLTSQGSGAVPTWTTVEVGDITAVTAGSGLTGGGSSGDVTLSLDSNAVIAPTLLTATGDMIYASAASTPARLGIGTTGQILSVSGGVPTWITASGVSLNGFTNSVTPFNTALGFNAGVAFTANSVANTAIGWGTLDLETSGDYNTALGHTALGSQNGGTGNTALGANAGGAITTGSDNTFVGYGAGDATTLSTGSVAIGRDALGANYNQVGAVAVGLNAMLSATTAARSTAVGYASMDALTTGANNTAVGYSSLGANVTGTDNTAVGNDALLANTGSFNTAVGSLAGDAITSGSNNISIGYSAHGSAVTPSQQVAVGVSALQSSSATGSTAVGYRAGLNSTVTVTAIGWQALNALTTGASNTAVGYNAGAAVTTGLQNTFIGNNAGDAVTNGTNHVAVGHNALSTAVSSTSNTAIGSNSLQNATGNSNTAIGTNSGAATTSGALNIFVGYQAGDAVTTGSNNTILGDIPGSATLTDNLILGAGTNIKLQVNENNAIQVGNAGGYGSVGQVLTSNGSGAAASWTTISGGAVPATPTVEGIVYGYVDDTGAYDNVGLGTGVLGGTGTAGYGNTAVGWEAGSGITSGTYNVMVGWNAGQNITTESGNILLNSPGIVGVSNAFIVGNASTGNPYFGVNEDDAVGVADGLGGLSYGTAGQVLQSNGAAAAPTWVTPAGGLTGVTDAETTALGSGALTSEVAGVTNTALGVNAGAALVDGDRNTFVGYKAGQSVLDNLSDTFIGHQAGINSTGDGNTSVGAFAGPTGAALSCTFVGNDAGSISSGNNNVGVGASALSKATGGNNTAYGSSAGQNVTTGTLNTFIGFTAGAAVTTGSSNTILGDVNGTTTLSNNLILAAGTTIKLQVNENGAVGVGSTPAYGTSQQVLTSAGTGAAPTWETPVWLPLTPQTLTTTTPTTILTLPIADFRGCVVNISVSDTTGGRFHTDSYQINHDGAATSVQTFAGAHIGVAPYSLSATISAGNLLIQVTSTSTNSTKYVGAYETFAI